MNQAKDNGLEDGVVTIEEIRSGTESQGTGNLLMLIGCIWLAIM